MRKFRNSAKGATLGAAIQDGTPWHHSGAGRPVLREFLKSLLAVLLAGYPAAAVFAETASEKPSVDVRRVGAHIGCQCGCKDTVATCAMLECSFSKPAKEKIAKLQAAGWNDKAIIDQF